MASEATPSVGSKRAVAPRDDSQQRERPSPAKRSATAGSTLVIAYAISNPKKKALIFDRLVKHARSTGYALEVTQLTLPTEQDPNPVQSVSQAHVLMHKVGTYDPADPQHQRIAAWLTTTADGLGAVLVDPLDAVRCLYNRVELCFKIRTLSITYGRNRGIPTPFISVAKQESLAPLASNCPHRFPLIYKPQDGSSHGLHMVWKVEGLLQVAAPCILQPFVNHDGFIFKVYAVGDRWTLVRRTSLPNVTHRRVAEAPAAVEALDRVSNPLANEESHEGPDAASKVHPPPSKLVDRLVPKLRELLGVNMFGFDLILETGSHYWHVIDVNYFPGYYDAADLPSMMVEMLEQYRGEDES